MKKVSVKRSMLPALNGGLLAVFLLLFLAPRPAVEIVAESVRTAAIPQKPALPSCGRLTGFIQHGLASWYGPGFDRRRTSGGERFDMLHLTAAHRTLPLNTQVRVTNQRNGESVILRITDRGPYVHGRLIDLSLGAAMALDMQESGIAPVKLEIMCRPGGATPVRPRRPVSI